MMKKLFLLSILFSPFFFSTNTIAQTIDQIAFVNSLELLDAIPAKVEAANKIKELNQKYKDEFKVIETDYNKKYADFISYQTSMAEGVRNRRMQELYELERALNEFMEKAQKDIDEQEELLIAPLRQRVKDAIYQVGIEQGYVCIYDLANPAIAFVTPNAKDANNLVKQKLGIKVNP